MELNASGSNGIPLERRNLLANIRTPRSLGELFCRVCQFSYSCNYIPQYNKIFAPLRKVIKDIKFRWTAGENNAFQSIKLAIALNFKNHSVDSSLPLLLMVDSIKVATSFMVFQLVDMDSRIFAETEMGQPSVTREALGIVYGLRKKEQFYLHIVPH